MARLVVLGAGESGIGTAILAKKEGFEVFVSDNGTIQKKYKDVLKNLGVEWEEEGHSEKSVLSADLVMKSPGIPDKVNLVQKLHAKGTPVLSEIEFASRYTDATIIGITGSNGKTTTTMLTYHLLHSGGLNVGMAGNIGDSFAKMVAENDFEFYVLEISSFQLDGISDFRPHIAVITNITPDHLDRYEYSFEKYVESKFRIAMNQSEEDFFIYDMDDPVLSDRLKDQPVKPRLLPFSLKNPVGEGASIEEDKILIRTHNKSLEMNTSNVALAGKHNLKNTMAASLVANLVGIRKESIRESIKNFQ